jgi:hypothetical protein
MMKKRSIREGDKKAMKITGDYSACTNGGCAWRHDCAFSSENAVPISKGEMAWFFEGVGDKGGCPYYIKVEGKRGGGR